MLFCDICEKTEQQIILLAVPLTASFKLKEVCYHIATDDLRYICLGCLGYDFDGMMRI